MSRTVLLIVSIALFTVITVLVTPSYGKVNMTEGRWEIITEMSMEGMPFQMPPTRTFQCITKENPVPRDPEKEKNCKTLSQSIRGNTVEWKVRCEDKEGTTEAEGQITYTGASYKGNMTAKMTDRSGKTETVKMKLAGKRVGECTDADKRQRENLMAQADRAQSVQQDMEARLARARELGKLTVPEDGPGACSLSDSGCTAKFNKLNLLDGQWEMAEEGTTIVHESTMSKPVRGKTQAPDAPRDIYSPADTQKTVRCLTEQDALSYTKEASCVNEKKRSGNRITWKNTCTQGDSTTEERGGITYGGDTYDGVRIKKVTTKEVQTTQVAKLSGRRTGDGNCVATRDYTSKGQPKKPDPLEAGKDAIQNPVKSLKKIFGF